MISLEQAQQLVALLEVGKQEDANDIVLSILKSRENPIVNEVGSLARDLHDALDQFKFDPRMSVIATEEIPDARDRLEYVITKTELAANKTMDAVERSLPIADKLHESLLEVRPTWNELMKGRIELSEFKSLCLHIDDLLSQIEGDSTELRSQLTEILMAQDFQDLTGQVIRKVIDLVREVEDSLINMLTAFGLSAEKSQESASPKVGDNLVEGPIVNKENRDDVVEDQDDVDDLLSSLGF